MAKTSNKHKAYVEKAEAKMMGSGAPVVTQDNYKISLMQALNYYNSTMENGTRAKVVHHYLKKNNSQFRDIFSLAPDWEFLNVSSLVLIKEKGQYLSEEHQNKMTEMLNNIYDKYKNTRIENEGDVEFKADKPPVISIEQRIIDSARTHSEQIDYAIDQFIRDKASSFSTKSHLLANNISSAVAKRIGEYYQNTLNEINEAIEGQDEQLVEGYSFLSKVELRRFRDFIKSIVDDCAQHQVTAKKPRIMKAKPPAVIVKKLKFLREFAELNLKSCNPADIVGADELWVYNTKNRKLTNYTAANGDVLSVKGTTILNYDVSQSQSMTLRKPEEFFKNTTIGKRAMSNAIKEIKTKPSTPNGRINEDTILVGAFK
jgi:hypothetical protein